MKVAVAVAGAVVPAWNAWTIESLRAVEGLDVAVVDVCGVPWKRPAGNLLGFGGEALAPHRIAPSGTIPPEVDLVVDLAGVAMNIVPPLGIWSFRLGIGDDPAFPFADELASGAATFEIALERRRGELRDELRRGRFAMMMLHAIGLRTALRHAARWPGTFAAAARDGIVLTGAPAAPPAQRTPALRGLRASAGMLRNFVGGVLDDLLVVTEWNVGFADGGPAALLRDAPLAARWLPSPAPLTFIADPFLARRDGRVALFVEEFDYRRNRGVLEAIELDGDRVVRREQILDAGTHLSYPYPVEIDGELYLVPESCAAREVALYRCVDFPFRWEREDAMLPAFDGVDTTIFPHDGRWWLTCTRYSEGSTLALYAYHAPSPRGPWTAHALNPIVTDVARARPAGRPIVIDGELYRPAQDCSRSYGCGLVLARIDVLTPTAYGETVVRRMQLAPSRWNEGLHTVALEGDRIVVDGKRTSWDLRKLAWALRRAPARIGRLLARRPGRQSASRLIAETTNR